MARRSRKANKAKHAYREGGPQGPSSLPSLSNESVSILGYFARQLQRSGLIQALDSVIFSGKALLRQALLGMVRGFGFGLGFLLLSAVVLLVLRELVARDLPWVGRWIEDITHLVEGQFANK